MLTRRLLTAGLGLGLLPGLAQAAEPVPEPLIEPLSSDVTDIGAGRDVIDRLTIPVMVDGQGPFRFVVDTGADRSVICEDIAAGLGRSAGPVVLVHGIAGAENIPTIQVGGMQAGSIALKGGDFPVMPRSRLRADGLLGVDALQNRRLTMDFRERALRIAPSSGFDIVQAKNEATISARKRFGRLTVVDARADRVPTAAFIDSGAELSVGNLALAHALAARREGQWAAERLTQLFGVTSHTAYGEVHRVGRLKMGGLTFSDLSLVFSDLHLFKLWNLNDRPALLLGMNVLRLFACVDLDYGVRAVRFRGAALEDTPFMMASA